MKLGKIPERDMREHQPEIDAIEVHINREYGGDVTIEDLIRIMIARGWTPPQKHP